MPTFGERVRKIRERSMQSMSDAARALGISLVYYSDIERGRRNPPMGEKLEKLANFLGLPVKEVELWANKERERVELDIKEKAAPVSEAALMLAKRWDDITEDEARDILKILNRRKQNG